MRRTAVAQVLSLIGALLVASSAPGIALLHGRAHLLAAAHDEAHRTESTSGRATAGQAEVEPSEHEAHPHLDPGAAVTQRVIALEFVAPTVIDFGLATHLPTDVESPRKANVRGPSPAPPGSPPQPRAPPLG